MALTFKDSFAFTAAPCASAMKRLALAYAFLLSASLHAAPVLNRPVASLDVQRYMGQWHEIAHLPLFFQRKCVGPTTATSLLAPDRTIRLHSTCPTRSGHKIVDLVVTSVPGQPAAFKIRVAGAWLSWLPDAWFEYWVVDIDRDYRWAVVGGPGAKHLWILSREPTMSRGLYATLIKRARSQGYPVEKLVVMTPLE